MKDENIFDFQEFKKNYKWTHFKAGVRDKWLDAKAFYQNNREECLIAIPAIAAGIGAITKFAGKRLDARNERIHKDRQFYDRTLDTWLTAKRKPTKKEMDIIAQRRANHESYYKILSDMKLI